MTCDIGKGRRRSSLARRSAISSPPRRFPGRGSTTATRRWWRPRRPCPPKPATCPFPLPFDPCALRAERRALRVLRVDASTTRNDEGLLRLQAALTSGRLPAVSFVKAIGYKPEHPGVRLHAERRCHVRDGPSSVECRDVSLRFEHARPPHLRRGRRLLRSRLRPLRRTRSTTSPTARAFPSWPSGRSHRKNFVSHVVMEHSSIVKFIEWNLLGQQTGQLGTRDTS